MLTPIQAAILAGRRPDLVYHWLQEGRVTGAVRTDTGRWLIPPEAVAQLRGFRRVERRGA